MFTITNENLHIYIFTIIGLIVLCFAFVFYVKNSLETDINALKKKIKKMQVVQQQQQTMYNQLAHQQEQLIQHHMQEQQEQEQEQQHTNGGDMDSYMDPSG